MAEMMTVYTIGSSGKSAEQFFDLLAQHAVERVIDVRLSNRSQLTGFTKATDLPFFLRSILEAEHLHLPMLAPTKDLLDAYKTKQITWEDYEQAYRAILAERQVEVLFDAALFANACLLCSEATATHCHRRLAGEYLQLAWGTLAPFKLVHL
jgi:uncharacterized protein (DUF488 family)